MLKILLVDDEPVILHGLKALVNWEIYDTSICGMCANAIDAINSMADIMPDILITDIRMPGMSGLELIEQALKMNPSMQCIILSGHDDFSYAHSALKMGVKEYLLKPCTRDELTQALLNCKAENARERAQINCRFDIRNERLARLEHELQQMQPLEGEAHISATQVNEALAQFQDPSLLREAFVRIVLAEDASRRDASVVLARLEQLFQETATAEYVAQYLTSRNVDQPRCSDFVRQMRRYIKENYSDAGLSLQYMADHVVHMNADYISREFVRQTQMKFSAYLLKTRMEAACHILRENLGITIQEVAQSVGLGHNPQYFSLLFKKHTGMTVKEYRKER